MRETRVGAWPQGRESAMNVVVKADDDNLASCLEKAGPRSLFCRSVRSVVSSNSKGAGSFDSRTDVADLDGENHWGSAKMQETLICTSDCLQAVRKVPATFVSNISSEAEW